MADGARLILHVAVVQRICIRAITGPYGSIQEGAFLSALLHHGDCVSRYIIMLKDENCGRKITPDQRKKVHCRALVESGAARLSDIGLGGYFVLVKGLMDSPTQQ